MKVTEELRMKIFELWNNSKRNEESKMVITKQHGISKSTLHRIIQNPYKTNSKKAGRQRYLSIKSIYDILQKDNRIDFSRLNNPKFTLEMQKVLRDWHRNNNPNAKENAISKRYVIEKKKKLIEYLDTMNNNENNIDQYSQNNNDNMNADSYQATSSTNQNNSNNQSCLNSNTDFLSSSIIDYHSSSYQFEDDNNNNHDYYDNKKYNNLNENQLFLDNNHNNDNEITSNFNYQFYNIDKPSINNNNNESTDLYFINHNDQLNSNSNSDSNEYSY